MYFLKKHKRKVTLLFLCIFLLGTLPVASLTAYTDYSSLPYEELVEKHEGFVRGINEINEGIRKFDSPSDRERSLKVYKEELGKIEKAIRAINPNSPILGDSSGPGDSGGSGESSSNPGIKGYDPKELEETDKKTDYGERFVASILMAIPNYLVDVIGLDDPMTLIFNMPPEWKANDIQEKIDKERNKSYPDGYKIDRLLKDLEETKKEIDIYKNERYLHTFSEGEFRAIATMYHTIDEYLPLSLVVAIAILGYLLLGSIIRGGEQRGGIKLYVEGVLVAILLLKFGPYIWQTIFNANNLLVNIAKSSVHDKVGFSFLEVLYNPEAKSLGNACIGLIAVTSIGVLNWQYIMRKIILAILIIVFPVVAIAGISPGKRSALVIWIREMVSNVFLQAVHAFVFAFFINYIYEADTTGKVFWTSIAFLLGINMVSGLVRRILGAESVGSGMVGGVGAALGVGAIFAMSRMATGATKGKDKEKIKESLSSSAREAVAEGTENVTANSTTTLNETGRNVGGFSNSTSSPVQMKNMTQMRNVAQKGKEVAGWGFSKATPLVAGMVGMTGGAIVGGALTGNPGIGASVGGMVGIKTGSGITSINSNVFNSEAGNQLPPEEVMLMNAGFDEEEIRSMSPEDRKYYSNNLQQYQNVHTKMLEYANQNLEEVTPRVEMVKEEVTIAKASGNEELVKNRQAELNSLKAKQSQHKIQEIYAKDALKHTKQSEFIGKLSKAHKKPPSTGGLDYTI